MRSFLTQLSMSIVIMSFAHTLNSYAESPRIVVVGAGLAGLSAAYTLEKDSGLATELYEASDRVGGRVYTKNHGDSVRVELGASFIDEDHHAIKSLVSEMDLKLVALKNRPSSPLYFFDALIDQEKLFKEFKPWLLRIQRDIDAIDEEKSALGSERLSPTEQKLNQLSIKEYLDEIGAPPLFQRIAQATQSAEYGPGIEKLNALSLLDLIDIDLAAKSFVMDGQLGDEGHKVEGGNSRLAEALASKLSTPIQFHHELIELSYDDTLKKYLLHFLVEGSTPKIIEADYVIVALPMPVLKNTLKFDENLLQEDTRRAINAIPVGHVSKFIMRFSEPLWRKNSNDFFELVNDYYDIWDSSVQEEGNREHHLTVYMGEPKSLNDHDKNPQELAEEVLALLEKIFPSIRNYYLGPTKSLHWPSHPLFQGAFTGALFAGQWELSKLLNNPGKGNLVFAGEQWHNDHQGFMNGAVESGQWAAHYIAKLVNNPFVK